ncbi:MAG: RDD family protein [Myxococcota bacterium]|nr:RDD family protein [Myxococcota bacterium]
MSQPMPPRMPRRSAVGRADPRRRLLASGPEALLLLGVELASAPFVPLGIGASLVIALWFCVRDLVGGAWNPGKRLAQVRLVDASTGRVPGSRQAILRNLPYVLGMLLGAVPGIEIAGWSALAMMALLDLGMVLIDPLGRRLGDRLAGTKVVAGHPGG